MSGFVYLIAAGVILVVALVLLSRPRRCTPECRAQHALAKLTAEGEREIWAAAHVDAALRLVAEDNVRQLPVQRQAGEWS